MKLRIKANSIRLRLLRSEVATFLETGRLEETVHFGAGDEACLTYGLEYEAGIDEIAVRHKRSEVTVVIPSELAKSWAGTEQVGIYSNVEVGSHGGLEVSVEKDFACLDLTDAENEDTFPNPQLGTVC